MKQRTNRIFLTTSFRLKSLHQDIFSLNWSFKDSHGTLARHKLPIMTYDGTINLFITRIVINCATGYDTMVLVVVVMLRDRKAQKTGLDFDKITERS